MDLDGASLANSVLLPDTLERLLAELVAVLKSALPPDSLVARCGCDEFAAHVTDPKHAAATAEFVRSIIHAMWKRERAQMYDSIVDEAPLSMLTLSVGVAWHVNDPVDTVREAQSLCDVAKRAGGNRVIARRT
jgi:GGDEF domain-containing protein